MLLPCAAAARTRPGSITSELWGGDPNWEAEAGDALDRAVPVPTRPRAWVLLGTLRLRQLHPRRGWGCESRD